LISADKFESSVTAMADHRLDYEQVTTLIAQLSKRWSLPELCLDDSGSTSFCYANNFDISLLYFANQPGLVAAAPLLENVAVNFTLLKSLLFYNQSWLLTQGDCFGSLPNRDDVMLFRVIPIINNGVEDFDAALAQFAERAAYWRDELVLALKNNSPTESLVQENGSIESKVIALGGLRV